MSVTAAPLTAPLSPAVLTPTTPPAVAPRLHAHRVGAGDPLVLLHGLGESSIGWRPVMDALATEYDVIALDLPGFGRSAALPAHLPPSAVNLAAVVHTALDDLGVGQYHVAGYSLGARVAVQLAASPRVLSLIAIAPDGLGTPLERLQGYVACLTGRSVAIALAPAAAQLSLTAAGRSMFFSGNRSRPWSLPAEDARQLLTDFASAPAYDAANLASLFDMPTHLHTIAVPALFLQGTADPLMNQQTARYASFITGAKLRWLPGLNHVPISDDPDTVAGHMLEFLSLVGSTPAG